jgi:hypothetical protein
MLGSRRRVVVVGGGEPQEQAPPPPPPNRRSKVDNNPADKISPEMKEVMEKFKGMSTKELLKELAIMSTKGQTECVNYLRSIIMWISRLQRDDPQMCFERGRCVRIEMYILLVESRHLYDMIVVDV